MINITLDIHEDITVAIEKIKLAAGTEVQLEIPEGSVLFENVLNLKILKKSAEDFGKTLQFKTTDEAGQNLIASLNGTLQLGVASEFMAKEVSAESVVGQVSSHGKGLPKPKFKKPKIALSLSFLKFLNPSSVKSNLKKLVPVILLLGASGVFVYLIVWKVPKAQVKIVVNSQPLIKSLPIKVIEGFDTDVEERILKGYVVGTTLIDSLSRETTGEKLVGEKAKGEVKIYNKTTVDKKFTKGTMIIYDDGDKEYIYVLDDDVTVPARVDEEPDPADPDAIPISIWGDRKVEIVANDIGESYNLDKGKSLKFENHDKSNFSVTVSEKVVGGSSKTVKIVTEEDKKAVADNLFEKISERVEEALIGELSGSQEMIYGSESVTLTSQEFSVEVGDEIDEVEVTQTVKAEVLAYSSKDLDPLLDELLKDFVPEGFELSTDEREVNVEILGNTDDSVLSTGIADLQVTLKSHVISIIDEDEIKEKLAGKSLSRAERILGSIRNVKTYEVEISPNIPFFQRLPSSVENIDLNVERK